MNMITCECGAKLMKPYLSNHLKSIRHKNLMTDKDYYDKEKIYKREEESKKKYYQDHKEAILQKYDDNREAILQKKKEYRAKTIKCDCGVEVCRNNLSHHLKTRKHLNKLNGA